MSKKLARGINQIELVIQRAREECREVWHEFKEQPGFLICRLIHMNFLIATSVGAIPYRVLKLKNGYRRLIPVEGVRKWLLHTIYICIVLRALFIALLSLSKELKMTVEGNLTADSLLWALSLQMATIPAIFSLKLMAKLDDIAIVYNSLGEFMSSATRKHLKENHIFEQIHINSGLLFGVVALGWGILTPCFATAISIIMKDTPASLSYHVTGPFSDIQDDDVLRMALYLIGALVDWIYLTYISWQMLVMMVLLGDAVVGPVVLIRALGNLDPKKMSWRDKNKIHAQAELFVEMFNSIAALAGPAVILAATMLSVCCNIVVLKMDVEMGKGIITMDLEKGLGTFAMAPFFVFAGVGIPIAGFIIIGHLEQVRTISIRYLEDVEAEITAYVKLEVRRDRRMTYCPTGRTFRRRPIGIRVWNFMTIEDGLSISFVLQILENTINYYFMVDLRSQPVWLWG